MLNVDSDIRIICGNQKLFLPMKYAIIAAAPSNTDSSNARLRPPAIIVSHISFYICVV